MTRLRNKVPPTLIRCQQGSQKLTFTNGQPELTLPSGTDALTEAIKRLEPGVLNPTHPGGGSVEWSGEHRGGLQVGTGTIGGKYVAWWKTGRVSDVAIVSPPSWDYAGQKKWPSIFDITLGDTRGGFDNLIFCQITLRNSSGRASAIILNVNSLVGGLRMWGCEHLPEDMNAWGGYGSKWGVMRGHGHLDFLDLIDHLTFAAQEHGWGYWDNLGWETGSRCRLQRIRRHPLAGTKPSGNTEVQITNRKWPGVYNGSTIGGGDSGTSPIIVSDFEAYAEGDNGAALTFAGHGGAVDVRDGTVEGGICFWVPVSAYATGTQGQPGYKTAFENGVHYYTGDDGKKYTTPRARFSNLKVAMGSEPKSAITVAGVEDVFFEEGDGDQPVKGFDLQTNKACIDLWNSSSGQLDNGEVKLDLPGKISQYAGFHGYHRIRKKDKPLSDAQMDAMAWTPVQVP